MTSTHDDAVTVLGLGAMGSALAAAALNSGRSTTVWNRSAPRTAELVRRGAAAASTAGEAVRASRLILVCVLDHASVHEVLDPLEGDLVGRTVINLTTTTPTEARELAEWAARAGVDYLDGGIMAVPSMIGQPGAFILYSGSERVFDRHRTLLERWGDSVYLGSDAGSASLYDLALLAGMYVMFAGFLHGAAMVASAGVSAGEFASMAAPWLTAMTGGLAEYAAVIDGGDYAVEGQQSLQFSDLRDIITASAEAGLRTDVLDPVQRLIQEQIAAGHGREGFPRIIESIRRAG